MTDAIGKTWRVRASGCIAAVLLAVHALGCADVARPPALPDRPPSATPLGATNEPGIGRVQVDVVGEPARVGIIDYREYKWESGNGAIARDAGGLQTSRGEMLRIVCERTPCVLDLPYGTYELHFGQAPREDSAFVTVGATPSYAVHAVGDRRPAHLERAALAGVLLGTAMAGIPLGVGFGVTSPSTDPQDPGWMRDAGARRGVSLTMLGVGIAALIAGTVFLRAAPEVDHSGPLRQWTAGGAP
jgi:hypothetical protein